jgi:hypothetical protein
MTKKHVRRYPDVVADRVETWLFNSSRCFAAFADPAASADDNVGKAR